MRTLAVALASFVVACSSSSQPAPSSTPDAGGGPTAADDASRSDTWASYASGFVTTYCVPCHDAKDTTGRDYTAEPNVLKDKLEIRCGVATTQDPSWGCASFPPPAQFPIGDGPKPSAAERARFVAWITAGAP